MQLYFIINPYAGNGRGKRRWEQFKQQLTVPYEVHWTEYAGHTLDIVKEIGQKATEQNPACLIGIGGDGTIHEVLNGAAHFEHVYIGMIAAGSGNDFARGYKTFENAQQIEQFLNLASTTATRHDYGIAKFNGQEKYFVNNFGVGFDALVAIMANESNLKKSLNKFKLGKLSYPYFVISALFTFKPFQLKILHNGIEKQYEKVWFATVSNQPYFGGGMNLSPPSNTTDGQLEVTVVSNISKWKLLFLFGSVFFAKHTQIKEVHQFPVKDIQFVLDEPVMAHADGEKQKIHDVHNEIQLTVQQQAWKLAK